MRPMRPGAAHFTLVFAYTTAAVNAGLAVVDLLVRLWLTAGLQLSLALAAVTVAYLVTCAEKQDAPTPWWLQPLISGAAFGLVLTAVLTAALVAHIVLGSGYSPAPL